MENHKGQECIHQPMTCIEGFCSDCLVALNKLICPNCGSDKDVVKRLEYVGGKGLTEIITCRDETGCWQRWDEQNLEKV